MQLKEIKSRRTNLNFSQIPNKNPKKIKTTLFHLNVTVCFDQNDLFWYKKMSFWLAREQKKQREMVDDLSSDYCSSFSTFNTKKVARVTIF
jgi:hypothetical protein